MSDPRIPLLVDAARRMEAGQFDLQLPVGAGDDLDLLALALQSLSRALDRRLGELQAVSSVAERVNAGLMLDEVCSQVYASFQTLIPYDRIGLALLEDDGRVLRARWAASEASTIHLEVGYSAPMAGSSLQRIVETGRPRIINDLESYLAIHPESESTRLVVAEGVRSSLTCPLIAEGKAVGFLFFSSFQRDTYRSAHIGVFRAIAAQLSVIVEKSRLYQELVELDGFRRRMLGVAAHDLRNPLTLVLTSLELLDMGAGGELSEQGRALVGQAMRASERMVALIENLLDVSAIDAGRLVLQPEPLDLGPWLAAVARDQQLLAGTKGIVVRTALPAEPLMAPVDRHRLEQVLVNLVSNALKYSPRGTVVTVAARAIDGGVELSVADQGPGIAEGEQQALFQPFSRTSNRPTGGETSTGLGLAISKRIVEAHGGTIGVESEVGRGSRFFVRLPG